MPPRADVGGRFAGPMFAGREIVLTAAVAGLVAASMVQPDPRLVWNASQSVPVGLYRIATGATLRRGDIVAVRLPLPIAKLAAARAYLPGGLPLMKRIAASPGAVVCAGPGVLRIDGSIAARSVSTDATGRIMPQWLGCRRLGPEEVLLLGDVAGSFDSRYFGPLPRGSVIGKAVPLWLP